MARKTIYTACTLALVLLFSPFAYSERGMRVDENRFALVIGNGAYKKSPLRNPANDAYDMAATLRKLGFDAIHLENANQRSMEDAIREFGRRLRKGGVGLFYFAGHGVQVNGRNYLIPIGAEIEKETDAKYEAVDAGRVLDEMYEAGNGLNIVILDACRDNPFARSFRTTTRGLARMDAPTGTFISYATAPGSVAADGRGRNGIFTGHLLKNMRVPGLKIEDVMKEVRNGVILDTGNKQVPWQSSSLTGNFYFISEKETVQGMATMPAQNAPGSSAELERERERLERERLELERARLELERKKLEKERKQLETEKGRQASMKQQAEPRMENPCKEIVGTWNWFNGVVIINANGTMEHGGILFGLIRNSGTWECTDPAARKFTLKWKLGGFVDILTLSPDSRSLDGQNLQGTRVTAQRKNDLPP